MQAVNGLIESLPEDCTVEDIQQHLEVLAKVLRGSRAIDEGRVRPHEEVGQWLDQWAAEHGAIRR